MGIQFAPVGAGQAADTFRSRLPIQSLREFVVFGPSDFALARPFLAPIAPIVVTIARPRVLQLSTAALGRAMSAVARDHGVGVEIIGGGIVGLKDSSVADLTVQLHGSAEASARVASDLAH